jgi:hypothetical protein
MSTTIYDSSLITARRRMKAESGDFLQRIQNASQPNTGYTTPLGIYDQSIIQQVAKGQMKYIRKGNGMTLVSDGCPCNSSNSCGF